MGVSTGVDVDAGAAVGADAGGPERLTTTAGAVPGGHGALGASDRAEKRRRVLSVLDEAGRESVLLTSAAAVNWYLDGARTHVSLAADPIVSVRVDRDRDTVVLTSNEHARLVAEELPGEVELEVLPWWGAVALPGAGGGLTGAAAPTPEAELAVPLRQARAALLPGETQRFRALGRETAEAFTEVLSRADPAMSEQELAARIAQALVARGIDPLVILVGGESRRGHRHPLPTAAPIGRRALVVACARRHGLIANISRWIGFGGSTSAESDADERILTVEQAFWRASRPGRTLGEAFSEGIAGYAANGFDPEEWRAHHQGGAAGYAGRDPRATPEVADPLVLGQALAWNPSAPGAKVEDTVLLTPEGIAALTLDPAWPTTGPHARPARLAL